MFKFGFLFAYCISLVLYGSLAGSGDNTRTVCLLDDPSDQFCPTSLGSTLDQISRQEMEKTLSKLEASLEAAWKKDYESRLDRLELGENRIEKQLRYIWDKLESSLESKKSDFKKDYDSKLDRIKPLLSSILNILNEVPKKFEQIGSRYYYIENSLKQNWSSAEIACQQMGGHLASFRSHEEIKAVTSDLVHVWLKKVYRERYS